MERLEADICELAAHLNAATVFHFDLGTVDNPILLALAPCIIDNGNLRVPIHDDPFALFILNRNPGVKKVGILLRIEAHELDGAGVLGFGHRLLNHFARRSTDVERPHGQLCSRLIDRLCRYDTNRLAFFNQPATGQITPITGSTDSTA